MKDVFVHTRTYESRFFFALCSLWVFIRWRWNI